MDTQQLAINSLCSLPGDSMPGLLNIKKLFITLWNYDNRTSAYLENSKLTFFGMAASVREKD